jgi:hypothetical protein
MFIIIIINAILSDGEKHFLVGLSQGSQSHIYRRATFQRKNAPRAAG